MHMISKAISTAALVATAVAPIASANAATRKHHHYYGRTAYTHKVCRRSSAATGKVVGGVAGAVAGPGIVGHGLLGAAVGAVGGVVAGGAVDRTLTAHRRCYYTR